MVGVAATTSTTGVVGASEVVANVGGNVVGVDMMGVVVVFTGTVSTLDVDGEPVGE